MTQKEKNARRAELKAQWPVVQKQQKRGLSRHQRDQLTEAGVPEEHFIAFSKGKSYVSNDSRILAFRNGTLDVVPIKGKNPEEIKSAQAYYLYHFVRGCGIPLTKHGIKLLDEQEYPLSKQELKRIGKKPSGE